MEHRPDYRVRDFGSTLLTLRGDLAFTPQNKGDETYYTVEDPVNSRFFRLGHGEYTLLTLLDGKTTLRSALAQLAALLPDTHLTENSAVALCHWLVENELAYTAESAQAGRLTSKKTRAVQQETWARFNPLVFRLPLFHPDDVFTRLAKTCGWFFSGPAFAVWLIIIAVGAYQLLSGWDRFAASAQTILVPTNWLWLAVCWITLKVLHETSHGIVAKRYGGTVRETGLMFVALMPLAYVDVTSIWRFRSRRQRIHVAVAGIYSELLIGAIAAIAWQATSEGWWINALCHNLVVTAAGATLVFNANPLMKFDGYYVLSDLLQIPNLYTNGQRCLQYFFRRYLLGVPATSPVPAGREAAITWCYGVASLMWRIALCATIMIGTVTMFHGAGIVLTAAAAALWIGAPAVRFAKYLVHGKPGEQPRRMRFAAIVVAGVSGGIALFGFVPWPGASVAPAVVEFAPPIVVRSASAGFVREIHAADGRKVMGGDLLMVLENDELASEIADLQLQIRQSDVRSRQHEHRGRLAALQAENEQRAALYTQLKEKEAQLAQLEVRAPAAGTVAAPALHSLLGTYLEAGEEIVTIGDRTTKQLRISISQDTFDGFTRWRGRFVHVDLPGYQSWEARLKGVAPRASKTPIHPAMVAVNGGPLPVREVPDDSSKPNDGRYEFLEPRFSGIVQLDPEKSETICVGQQATVSYRPFQASIGEHLWNTVSEWIRSGLAGRNG